MKPSPHGGTSRFGEWRLDRRRFLLASSGGLVLPALAACSDDGEDVDPAAEDGSAPLGANAQFATEALAPPGTAGLMNEAIYQQRIDQYLAVATSVDHSSNPTGIAAHLIRSAREPGYRWNVGDVTVESLGETFEGIDDWADTRDFKLMYLHWVLALGQGETDANRIDPSVLDAIRDRMLANRYRWDDPLPDGRIDNLWFWSENHRIITLAIEYLAGSRFPSDTFAVTGMTGLEHLQRARPEILDWIGERAELGFFEWHSNVYMLKNITPLLMLAELAEDPEIVTASAMALDLCLLDLAAHTHAGCYTAPRGRTYKKDKMSSLDEDTFGTAKFLFDDTGAPYPSMSDGGATYLCGATRYRPPQLMVDIATAPGVGVVRERHGVFFDGSTPVTNKPEAPYGYDFEDPENLPFWWSLGAVGMWPLARVSVASAEKHKLWETELFEQVTLLAALNEFDPERIRVWEQERSAVINFGFLSEANTYAYRDPAVSLATVVDHRPGEMRDQVHSWQAAIDENAMVFTNHPVTEPDESTDWSDDPEPGYWTGEASMPRSAQHERTAVHLYEPAWDESTDPLIWSVFGYRPFTHAYVPQDHFEEVRQVANWTICAKSGGYIALWSWRVPVWREYDPEVIATRGMKKPFDLVAEGGPDNVWIVEVGNESQDGDLDAFIAGLTRSEPAVTRDSSGFDVQWISPSSGLLLFSSTGPFLVDGSELPLSGFPRHESSWGTIDHLDTSYELSSDSAAWAADFGDLTRRVS